MMIFSGWIIWSGIFLRILFLGTRSLWLDEAWLANALLKPDFEAAWHSLEAPVPALFVLLIRFLLKMLPANEFILRLLPCVAGIFSMVLAYQLAKHFFGQSIAKISGFLISFNAFLIYYSKELKQYSLEMMAGLLAVSTIETLLRKPANKTYWLLSFFIMLIAPFASYTFIFITPAIFVIILKENKAKRISSAALLIPLTSIIGCAWTYLTASQPQANSSLFAHWQVYLMDLSGIPAWLNWMKATLFEFTELYSNFYFCRGIARLTAFSAVWILFFIGFIEMLRKRNRFLIYWASIIISFTCVAALRQFPVAPRLLLFAAPFAIMTVAAGIEAVKNTAFKRIPKSIQVVLIFSSVVLYAIAPIRDNLLVPIEREEMRPLVHELTSEIRESDGIYVYHSAKPAFEFYWKEKNTVKILFGNSNQNAPDAYRNELVQAWNQTNSGRLWIIFSHADRFHDAKELILNTAAQMGKGRASIKKTGAEAYLFQK